MKEKAGEKEKGGKGELIKLVCANGKGAASEVGWMQEKERTECEMGKRGINLMERRKWEKG